MAELNRMRSRNMTRDAGRIPPDVLKRIGEKISAQASEPWRRIKTGLPDGVNAEA